MSYHSDNNSICGFADSLVSYLYDEIEAGEKSLFETHLKNCSNCADELESFGFARSAVLDWRTAEFESLKTPVFNIPSDEKPAHISAFSAPVNSLSWLARLKGLFSFKPIFATATLAILLVGVIAVFYSLNSKSEIDLAGQKASNSVQTVNLPVKNIVEKSETRDKPEENNQKNSSLSAVTEADRQIKREKSMPAKTQPKVSVTGAKRNAENSTLKPENLEVNEKRAKPAKKDQLPDLNDIEENEDNTIRLADLFDEIDTK